MSIKRTWALAMATLIVSMAMGCGEADDPIVDNPTTKELRSDKPRETPDVPQQDLATQVRGNNTFAFDLYQQLPTDGNLFYSPHSISVALAMVQAGARNNTEQQMAHALHYLLPQNSLHPVLNKLDQELQSRGENAKAADGKAFRLNVVNAIWGQEGYSFLSSYLDVLAINYGAGLHPMNFIDRPEYSRTEINKWVLEQTENRIKDLLPPGSIDPMTRLVLTNAIYFNAAWADPFKEEATQPAAFTLLDNSTTSVEMMRNTTRAGYAEGADYKAVALPYDGDELSMVVIVPEPGKFKSFEQALSYSTIDGVIQGLSWEQVIVNLPRFEYEDKHQLKEKLIALGMTDAFANADFSGIDGTRSLVISEVLHKSFIKVNEAGTEAAAATAVIMAGSAPVQHPEVVANRPFIFLIRDHATGAILFVGRVLDPSA
jgi:serpin B